MYRQKHSNHDIHTGITKHNNGNNNFENRPFLKDLSILSSKLEALTAMPNGKSGPGYHCF